jgi:hypothetical protein
VSSPRRQQFRLEHASAKASSRAFHPEISRRAASVLTPELKEFIDRAIVPALVEQYLDEIELAKKDADAANSGSATRRIEVSTVRP